MFGAAQQDLSWCIVVELFSLVDIRLAVKNRVCLLLYGHGSFSVRKCSACIPVEDQKASSRALFRAIPPRCWVVAPFGLVPKLILCLLLFGNAGKPTGLLLFRCTLSLLRFFDSGDLVDLEFQLCSDDSTRRILTPGDHQLTFWYIGREKMRVNAVFELFIVVSTSCFAYGCEVEGSLDLRRGPNLNHTVCLFVHSHKEEWLVLPKQVSVNNGAVLDTVQYGLSYEKFGVSIASPNQVSNLSNRSPKQYFLLLRQRVLRLNLYSKQERITRNFTNRPANDEPNRYHSSTRIGDREPFRGDTLEQGLSDRQEDDSKDRRSHRKAT